MKRFSLLFISLYLCPSISAGFWGTVSNFLLENKSTVSQIMAASVATGFITSFVKHTLVLRDIEQRLAQSDKSTHAGKQFLFGTYLKQDPQFAYPTDIQTHKELYAKKLSQDIHLPQKMYIKTENNSLVTLKDVRQALADEKIYLETLLKNVAAYTDVPQKLLTWYQTSQYNNKRISLHADQYKYHMDNFISAIENIVKQEGFNLSFYRAIKELCALNFKEQVKKEFFYIPFFNPCTWVIAPCHYKATQVFQDLVLIYARLLAMKEIVDSDASVFDQLNKDLGSFINYTAKENLATALNNKA